MDLADSDGVLPTSIRGAQHKLRRPMRGLQNIENAQSCLQPKNEGTDAVNTDAQLFLAADSHHIRCSREGDRHALGYRSIVELFEVNAPPQPTEIEPYGSRLSHKPF